MEHSNKILIWAVLILLIAIVSFNFKGITGEITGDRITAITLDKTSALPSETITLKIVPGAKGVYESIDIYNADNDYRYMQSAASVCRSNKCEDISEVKFKLIDSFEPGTYYFRAYDLYSEEYIKAYFTVGVKYQPAGPKERY